MLHGTVSNGTFTNDPTSTVNYTYDTYGRTSQVQFGAKDLNFARTFTYSYTYSTANRVLTQTMGWNMYSTGGSGSPPTVAESYGMSYQWDNEGKMTSYTDVNGIQYAYQYDGMGRATNLAGQCASYIGGQCYLQTYATATYGPANQLLTLSYTPTYENGVGGNYVNETRTYNSLLQVTNITASGGYNLNMTYNYPASNNGRIASSVDAVNSQTVNYTYDGLNRLTAAQATGGWGESYTYDGFGNLSGISPTGQGGETWSAVINESTNQLQGVNYDANGNQIGDQVHTNYVWNVENRMFEQLTPASGGGWYGGKSYSYDPSGRRVMTNANADPQGTITGTGYGAGTWEFYFYGLNGQKMATIDCTYNTGYLELCQATPNAYFAGQMIAEGGWSVVTDRLGSVRGNGALNSGNIQYFPYGAEQTATTEGVTKFATYIRDAVGQDYAEQRYYNAGMGRYWSPDRGHGTRLGKPTSWNRYAYAGGDPVNRFDPHGREDVAPADGNGGCWVDDQGNFGCQDYVYLFIVDVVDAAGDDNTETDSTGDGDPEPPDPITDGPYTPPDPAASYPAALRLVLDCYWAGGTSFTVGYTREMDWQVVDQNGKPFLGSSVPDVVESITLTGGSTSRGKSWTDTWSRSNNTIDPHGIFDDYLSANGRSSFTATQSFTASGNLLTLENADGTPFAGVGGTSLNNSYSKTGVTVDGTSSPRPCTGKDKKW